MHRVALSRTALVSRGLAVLAGLCLAIGGLAAYTESQLVDERAFSARMAASLDDEAVRRVIAERIVDGLVEATSNDLLAVRPLLRSGIEALVATEPFRRLFALAAADAHQAILFGESSVILELDRAGVLLLEALRGLSPNVAQSVPADVEPVLAELAIDDLELGAARRLHDLAGRWWLIGALVVGIGAVALASDRRRGLARLAAAAAAAGALIAAAVVIAGEIVATHGSRVASLEDADERAALHAVWNAAFADLRSSALLAVVAALAVSVVAAGVFTPAHLRGVVQRAKGLLATQDPWARGARGLALVVIGAAALLEPGAAARIVILAVGVVTVFFGAAEVATALERRAERRPSGPRRRPAAAGGVAVLVVALCALVAVAVVDVPRLRTAEGARPAAGCNGSRALCDRRIGEIVFPGTHNSFAAAEQEGWLFANQRFGIARQLGDGIRALLLDIHYGVPDPASGRIRTDLDAEGTTRNRAARDLSPEALETADRLAGRVGLGELGSERGLYLCHSLCELGSVPLADALGEVAEFLDRNPSEVIVFVIEPYVAPADLERALVTSRLLDRTARLERSAPLPTLGELVERDERLIVLTEEGGGSLSWYLPAFSFAQDTPLGAEQPEDFSCARFRGNEDSPLLLINHWIDAFPPRPTSNVRIGGRFLRDRIRRCTGARGIDGAIVATDFYERSGVIAAAREANLRAAAGG